MRLLQQRQTAAGVAFASLEKEKQDISTLQQQQKETRYLITCSGLDYRLLLVMDVQLQRWTFSFNDVL